MKPRIALFGLPPNLNIRVISVSEDQGQNICIYSANNAQSDSILEYVTEDIEIGCKLKISIMCSGICPYEQQLQFVGADISHVPNLRKQTNTSEADVSADWDIEFWKKWNAHAQHEGGLAQEKVAILDRTILVEPMWSSYYSDSKIDYFEKFHKLWIGLNAYAKHSTGESGDKKRILALVRNENLRDAFYGMLRTEENEKSAEKLRTLQNATGLNMTSDVVRDEIALRVTWIDFLESAKKAEGAFAGISSELDGLVFLTSTSKEGVFRDIFRAYHGHSASSEGRLHPFNLADAFCFPKAPQSIARFGRLIFFDPFKASQAGNLFSVEDFFGIEYASNLYAGQSNIELRVLEKIDPLFFRYLHILYKFRCTYFHGDLPLNKQNNELARTAYQSLHELYPAIL